MFSILKQWNSLAMFEKEEDKRMARIQLHIIAFNCFLSLLVLIINLIIWQDEPLTIILILGYILHLSLYVLIIKKHLFASSLLLTSAYILMVSSIATIGGGLHDYVVIMYPVIIMYAGLTAQKRGLFFATLLTFAGLSWLVFGEIFGWFVITTSHIADQADLLVSLILIMLAAWMVHIIISNMEYGLTQTWRELAERKRIENELRKLTRAVEQSPASIMIADLDGNIEYVNPRFLQITGYSFEEIIEKKAQSLNTNIMQLETNNQWEAIQSGKEWRGEFTNRKKDGSLYYESIIISPITNLDGVTTHYLTIKEDITFRKKAEADLLAAHAELEQRVRERTAELQVAITSLKKASRAKDEFLASISHELRTPLSGILGNAEMLQLQIYGTLTEKQIRSVVAIENEGKHLSSLINDILDFSELQDDSLSINISPCSLSAISYAALKVISDSATRKQQQASFNIVPDEIMINTDEHRVQQILLALLDNAIKFTPAGGKFGIDIIGDRENQIVKIVIWDTGIGIKEEDLPRLFQPFVQVDARLAREYEGAGLGLALVKQLTEILEGKISVESIHGQGSRFTVSLPWVG